MQLDLANHSQRWLGLQERELLGWVRKLARDINTAIDVGASEGVYTIYFLARTPAQKIYAFEPSPECLREVEENLALNNMAGDQRLDVIAKKVGDSAAEGWTTLDSLISTIVPPCLVKVDIDGGESDLLKGASRCLSLPGVRWIIEVHSKALEQDCLRVLNETGYHVEIVHNAWWRHVIPELRPGELNHWLVAYRDETNRTDGG
ncbi:MAG: FkbM family methyltransferase [Candidatus Acidiferrales bacterium]